MNHTSELQQAIQFHQANELDQAKKLYEAILEATPGQPDALHFLGLLHFQQGDSETAASLIRQAVEARPDYADAHNNLGNVLKGMGLPDAAESSYRTAISLNPEDHNAHSNLCVVLKALGRHEEAVTSGQHAVELAPGLAFTWLNLANALRNAGREQQALAAYEKTVELEPGFSEALDKYNHLRELLQQRGEISPSSVEDQIIAYRKLLEQNPRHPIARHMLAALQGDAAPDRAADDYVATLFDGMADEFDQHLAALGCRVPELVQSRLEILLPGPGGTMDVLDAGCGTGLLGEYLNSVSRALTGVDLSRGMLGKAAETGHYDKLVKAELTGFLHGVDSEYDLVVCAETLCYFGGLEEILDAIVNSLKPGGLLVFTTELTPEGGADEEGFVLHSHGRYSHSEAYVSQLLSALELDDIQVETQQLRMEFGQPVRGCIVSARVAPP
jgi:predicted TPR repeat methyltransferase